jgi:hypothetical protein
MRNAKAASLPFVERHVGSEMPASVGSEMPASLLAVRCQLVVTVRCQLLLTVSCQLGVRCGLIPQRLWIAGSEMPASFVLPCGLSVHGCGLGLAVRCQLVLAVRCRFRVGSPTRDAILS